MLDFNAPEFLVVGIVALLVIGPKDLPRALRLIGKWVGRARGVARQFRSGFDTMMREAELAELQQQWAAENDRIMREHPAPALPAPEDPMSGGPGIAADPALAEADPVPVMAPQPEIRPDPVVAEAAPAPAKKPRKPRTRKAAAS